MVDEGSRQNGTQLLPQVRRALDQIEQLANRAANDPERTDLGPEAIFWLLQIFPPPSCDDPRPRPNWLAIVDWLCKSTSIPALEGLRTALEELDRGIVLPGLREAEGGARGAKTPTEDFPWLQMVAEAWHAIDQKARVFCAIKHGENAPHSAVRDTWIKEVAPITTVNDWRKRAKNGPTEFRPRFGWLLHYGEADPLEMLRLAADNLYARKSMSCGSKGNTPKA